MKKPRNKPAKTSSDAVQEYDSSWIEQNYWIKIGLTKNQLRLVREFSRKYKFKSPAPVAASVRLLVMLSLSMLPQVENRWRQLSLYSEAENIRFSKLLDSIAEAQLAPLDATKSTTTKSNGGDHGQKN